GCLCRFFHASRSVAFPLLLRSRAKPLLEFQRCGSYVHTFHLSHKINHVPAAVTVPKAVKVILGKRDAELGLIRPLVDGARADEVFPLSSEVLQHAVMPEYVLDLHALLECFVIYPDGHRSSFISQNVCFHDTKAEASPSKLTNRGRAV